MPELGWWGVAQSVEASFLTSKDALRNQQRCFSDDRNPWGFPSPRESCIPTTKREAPKTEPRNAKHRVLLITDAPLGLRLRHIDSKLGALVSSWNAYQGHPVTLKPNLGNWKYFPRKSEAKKTQEIWNRETEIATKDQWSVLIGDQGNSPVMSFEKVRRRP